MEFSVYILKTDTPLTQEQFNTLLAFVSVEKRGRVIGMKSRKNAQFTLLGDVLVRSVICKTTGLENRQLEFSVNQHGKPYLINHPNIHFNISHSNNFIAAAFDNQPAGIDIEYIKPMKNMRKVAERFFAADEIQYIMSAVEMSAGEMSAGEMSADDNQTKRFFEIWTKKESNIKREGKGLYKPLPSFSVFDDTALTGNTALTGSTVPQKIYYHKAFETGDIVCHVCSSKKQQPEVTNCNLQFIIDNL